MTDPRPRLAPVLLTTLLSGCCVPSATDGSPLPDPYQHVNRPIFGFNEGLDRWVLAPAARGWTFATPESGRRALDRFFEHLRFPVRLVSTLGQGEVRRSGSTVVRFVVNTVVGIGGFFDPAADVGLPRSDEDFGQMFGRWGVPSGPYWMLPLLGPSNPRDAAGLLLDSAANVVNPASMFTSPLALVNTRALLSEQIDLAREAALDYYVFVRDAYLQLRDAQIRDAAIEDQEARPGAVPYDDLYDLEDELDETDPER